MIKSMTGFGRCEVQKENRKFTVELKSVNHRYLDVNIRMPKKLNFFETSIRTLLKSYASRGKVDIFITYEDASQSQVSVRYHAGIAGEYLKYLQQMETEFGLENDIRVSSLARFPEVFTMEEQAEDEDKLWNGLKEALEGAFRQFVETRTAEGENLKKDLLEKLSYLEGQVGKVEERSPQIVAGRVSSKILCSRLFCLFLCLHRLSGRLLRLSGLFGQLLHGILQLGHFLDLFGLLVFFLTFRFYGLNVHFPESFFLG